MGQALPSATGPGYFLTHFAAGPFNVFVVGVSMGALVWYLAGVLRASDQRLEWPWWRTGVFVAGVVAIVVAVWSGLAVYAMTDVTAHAVRHVILMMTAPALLSLGRPILLAKETGGVLTRRLLRWAARNRLLSAVGHPVPVWVLYLGSMYLMLDDRWFFGYMMARPVVMDLNTVAMVAIGGLYWGVLLATPGWRTLSYPARFISMLANMPFEVIAGIWLRAQTKPITPLYSVSDTQVAGEAFVVGATLVSTLWLVAVVLQWAGQALREESATATARW